MSLYAIGDLHLHFQSELKAPGQIHEKVWRDHEKHFAENCRKLIKDDDTLVLVGDHSWGKNMSECEPDLAYIEALPGRKILLRGNHDMFWDAKKTEKLNALYEGRLYFLQNNYYAYEDYALVGTKGFCFEGPFMVDRFGNIRDWDRRAEAQAEKLVNREIERLEASFAAAKADGYRKFIMFLHYPPTDIRQTNSLFTKIAEKNNVSQVIYGHCHGEQRFHDSIRGKKRGIRYALVSGDCLYWQPMKIL